MAQLQKLTPHELLGLRTVRSFYVARVGFYTVYKTILRYRCEWTGPDAAGPAGLLYGRATAVDSLSPPR